MSASERLAALDAAWQESGHNAAVEGDVMNALSEIVAVVRAAEEGRDHSLLLQSDPAGVEMVGWTIGNAQALHAALAALDAKLAKK